ncbi:GntR family transcriptional regulator [Desulfuribacillus alkaliarsenatis]|uniref:GntR family transcriptional regulator n=1 Tax=Desulfuribacillus alkaliarsenatis TaxID=766136 RepID=A0A1E5G2G1_9FIRM|nr:GntR family transcriptional regulator [Desulfuribacillus alkaliarsenatis]OEF97073.1 GntR family transcriptional regulator [Desulfuribacillus alkaliarsenatis]
MSKSLDDKKPIFIQIKEVIEDQIINEQLKEHDQIPSTNQLVQFYKVNHITVSKGINLLVEEEVVYKKRGVGMYVAEGAKEKLVLQRREGFAEEFVLPMLKEAKKLKLSDDEIVRIMKKLKGSVKVD